MASVVSEDHGLRTPNEGINQSYLKNWADVLEPHVIVAKITDRIICCFDMGIQYKIYGATDSRK
jgi:hypothetical protein